MSAGHPQPVGSWEHSNWNSPVKRRVSCHNRNPQSTVAFLFYNTAGCASLVDPISAVSGSRERRGRKHKKKTRTFLGFIKQSYNLTKSRFLGYITVVCCLFPSPRWRNMLYCHILRNHLKCWLCCVSQPVLYHHHHEKSTAKNIKIKPFIFFWGLAVVSIMVFINSIYSIKLKVIFIPSAKKWIYRKPSISWWEPRDRSDKLKSWGINCFNSCSTSPTIPICMLAFVDHRLDHQFILVPRFQSPQPSP